MIWDKWLGSQKTPDEKAAHKVAKIEAKAKVKAAKDNVASRRRRDSIEQAIIKVTDVGFVAALATACFVAYCLDMIFFFQQTPLLWLSCLLCAFGFVVRTIAICGGVVLEWAEEDEGAEKPDPLDWKSARLVSAARWFGRRFSFSSARMTLRVMTWACWAVCAYATVSFFGSGHEMRKFAQESISSMESVQVVNAETVVASIRTENEGLDKDKADIRADRDRLIDGARKSMSEAQTDGSTANDNLDVYEQNIARYNREADAKLAEKDRLIGENSKRIAEIQSGKGAAHIEAAEKKAESPPFLAVYAFLASITGWSTDGWTIWSALLFAFVFELIVDTGLKNYFRLKKRFVARLRTIEMRQVIEDANWELNRFNTISAANLANAKARAQAAEAQALQDREIADINFRLEREKSRTEAARQGVPWIDPLVELSIKQKLADAEADERVAKIEAEIRDAAARAEAARNPPKPPEPVVAPPPANDEPAPKVDWRLEVGEDGLNHYQRMQKKSEESKRFDKDTADLNDNMKVPTDDWRTRFNVGAG